VVRMGGWKKGLIQWVGKDIGPDGEIIDRPGRHILGGVRWIGFFPFDTIYQYLFEWTGVGIGGSLDAHPKELLRAIVLKDDVYGLEVSGAEDKGRMPLDLACTMTVRIVNIRKALFDVQNWFETLVNRLVPYVRDWVTHYTYQQLIEDETLRLDVEIMKALVADNSLEELRDRYGIEVRKLEIRDIKPQDEWLKITLAKAVAQADAEASSEEVAGVAIRAIAGSLNMSVEETREAIANRPRLQKQFWSMVGPMLQRRLAQKMGGSSVHIDVTGATGMEGSLLSLLGAFRGLTTGGGNTGPSANNPGAPAGPPAPGKGKKVADMTAQEAIDASNKLMGM